MIQLVSPPEFAVPALRGEEFSRQLAERGYTSTGLIRSALPLMARLGQINSEGGMSDHDRAELQARYERQFDAGRLFGVLFQSARSSLAAFGCLEPQFNAGGWLDYQLHGVNVHPNFRSERLGSAVVHLLVKQALDDGARQIELDVSNPIAMRMYIGAGFYETGMRRDEGRVIVMRRDFDEPRKVTAEQSPAQMINLANEHFYRNADPEAAV